MLAAGAAGYSSVPRMRWAVLSPQKGGVPLRTRMSGSTSAIFKVVGAAGAAVAGVATRRAKPTWQQSMLRIKDPEKSLEFYRDKMGMRLLDKLDFESMSFSLYFLASVADDEKTPEPGTVEAHQYLWSFPGTTLDDSLVVLWVGTLLIAFLVG
eukprot:Skav213273  [mRNA]  locus=scaffold2944:91144:91906:+ [translate_table: standard]